MKRNCLILIVLVISCVLLLQIGCQERAGMAPESKTVVKPLRPAISPAEAEITSQVNKPAAKNAFEDEPAARIAFEKAVHDLGEIGPGTMHSYEFIFTNTGNGILRIGDIMSACNCTVPKLSQREYAPGESGILEVKYHSGKQLGFVTRTLTVPSNDKVKPKVKLAIKAKIVAKVDYEPKTLKLSVKDENADCPEITIHSRDSKPFAISHFKSTASCITADYDPSVKRTEFVLEPKVDTERLQGGLKGRITISLAPPEYGEVDIPFNALPRFKISPPAIVIFGARPQKPIKKEAWVLNNYDEDFEVESVSSEKNIIKVLSQEKIGNRYRFELEITVPSTEDEGRAFTDVFFVNIKGGERLELPCTGTSL